MKVRLYRAAAQYRGYIDEYTLYFPNNKKERQSSRMAGVFVGCSPSGNGGVNVCNWEECGNFSNYNFGRKVKLESMPLQFQEWVRSLEKKWNDALKYDDDEHWDIWNRA